MKLSKRLLEEGFSFPQDLEINPVSNLPEKVIQFGEGNFLRAFVDWMIDRLNQQNLFNGRVGVVQPIEKGLCDLLNEQDGLYTLVLRGIEKGRVVEKKRLVTAISRALNPYSDWQGYLKCAENPNLRVVISNTTEAGITYEKEVFIQGQALASFPAKLTAFLFHRFTYFDGDPQKGMLILPCELIDKNGSKLKEIILRYIEEWQLPASFKDWIHEHTHFFNTLVDRIVTGYPRDEADCLGKTLGYRDRLLDTGEIFHLWVIEGDSRFKAELPFDEIGLNVVWTADLMPYRERKVRVLNGTHTMTMAVAYLCGLVTVKEAVEDPMVGQFMRKGLFNEILPVLSLPEAEKKAFADSVLERFQNPFIRHRWIDISLNSISKFKTRCLPTLIDYYQANSRPPVFLSFSLAALLSFYRGDRLVDGKLAAIGEEGPYHVSDDPRTLNLFLSCWQSRSDFFFTTRRILGATGLWGMDLNRLAGLTEAVAKALASINALGMRCALKKLLADKGIDG
jgi:tagaturonate reductase